MLVFGEKSNMPLYGAAIMGLLTIEFLDGSDLDILGYWEGSDPATGVGWGHTSQVTSDGLVARWGGDNTTGGPEYVRIGTLNEREEGRSEDYRFKLHFNWYRVGDGHAGRGARVVAKDCWNTIMECVSAASHRQGQKASVDDPGVVVTLSPKGRLISIDAF